MKKEQNIRTCTEAAIVPMQCYAQPILDYVMKDIDCYTFDEGISRGSFQFIYERHKNYLVSRFFGGDTLKYGTRMSDVFREYNKDALRLQELKIQIVSLQEKIRLSKKHNGNRIKLVEMVSDCNYFIKEFNDKSKPISKLINKYLK
jgi:hypothetical protein